MQETAQITSDIVNATTEGLVGSVQLLWNTTGDGLTNLAEASKRGKDKFVEKTKEADQNLKSKGIDVGSGAKKTVDTLGNAIGMVGLAVINGGAAVGDKLDQNEKVKQAKTEVSQSVSKFSKVVSKNWSIFADKYGINIGKK